MSAEDDKAMFAPLSPDDPEVVLTDDERQELYFLRKNNAARARISKFNAGPYWGLVSKGFAYVVKEGANHTTFALVPPLSEAAKANLRKANEIAAKLDTTPKPGAAAGFVAIMRAYGNTWEYATSISCPPNVVSRSRRAILENGIGVFARLINSDCANPTVRSSEGNYWYFGDVALGRFQEAASTINAMCRMAFFLRAKRASNEQGR